MYWVFTEDQLNKALSDYVDRVSPGTQTYNTTDFDAEVTNFLFSEEAKKLRGDKNE